MNLLLLNEGSFHTTTQPRPLLLNEGYSHKTCRLTARVFNEKEIQNVENCGDYFCVVCPARVSAY